MSPKLSGMLKFIAKYKQGVLRTLAPLKGTDSAHIVHMFTSLLFSTGKLFQSKDLLDFVHFFLMFYKVKPIDLLLNDIFLVRMCNLGEDLVSVLGEGVQLNWGDPV